MHKTEIAPNRWVVRKQKGDKKLVGTLEYHKFFSYDGNGERFLTGFWMSRLPENGWKETGWKKFLTEDEALDALSNPSKLKWRRI